MKLLRSSFWLHSIFYTFLQRFSLLFFGTFSYFILVRSVSTQQFAVWALYLAIFTMFEMIKQGLLRNPMIRFMGMQEYADKKNVVQSVGLLINIAISLFAILLITFFNTSISGFLNTPELKPLFYWSILFILLLIPFNHLEVVMQSQMQFQPMFQVYFLRQGSFFAAIFFIWLLKKDWLTIPVVVILQILSLLLGVLLLWIKSRAYHLKKFHYEGKTLKEMLHFGKYIFGTNLFASVSRSLDRFVTANAIPDAVVRNNFISYYDATQRVNMLLDVPSLAIADVLFPKNVQASEEDGMAKVKYYFERMCGVLLAIIIPFSLFIFIFPKFIILVLSGSQYYPAAPILQLTILFCIVRPLSYQFGSTLDAIGKPKVNFWVNFGMLSLNLVFSYFFLSRFGGIGAAYATMLTYTIAGTAMYIVMNRTIHVQGTEILRYFIQTYKDAWGFGMKFIRKSNEKA